MTIAQDNQRDELVIRKEGIERARKDALVTLRNALDDFAAKIGASRTAAADAMDYAKDMLGEITHAPVSEIEHALEELDAAIERDEKP